MICEKKKNIKMNHDNISKIYKNNGTNDDHSNSCYITEKTHMISKSEVSYDKYGNKTVIKKKQDNSNNNMMYRHNTFLKNKKSEINKKKNKLSKDPKTTIITPQEINKEITIENTFSHKKQNQKIQFQD